MEGGVKWEGREEVYGKGGRSRVGEEGKEGYYVSFVTCNAVFHM